MNSLAYLIDTNVLIGLEDNHAVQSAFAFLPSIAAKYKVSLFVHEAARDDFQRDGDERRRQISLSKLDKFQTLGKVRGLTKDQLEAEFGTLARPNDIVVKAQHDAITKEPLPKRSIELIQYLVEKNGTLSGNLRSKSGATA